MTSVTPAGTINCGTDCYEFYSYNTQVRLHATPAAGYVFAGWSGACGGTTDCFTRMTMTRYVKATFTKAASPGDIDPDADAFLPGFLDLLAWDPIEIWRLLD